MSPHKFPNCNTQTRKSAEMAIQAYLQHVYATFGGCLTLTLSLLPNIFIEPTRGTASFCVMNGIVLFLILQKLAVPRECNSS